MFVPFECCVLSRTGLADHSSRGVTSSVMCLSVIVKPQQRGGHGSLGAVELGKLYPCEKFVRNKYKPIHKQIFIYVFETLKNFSVHNTRRYQSSSFYTLSTPVNTCSRDVK
jgi:hypothetical protein